MKIDSRSVLFVGNDINNIGAGYSWKTLLKELVDFVGAAGDIQPLGEQFPLFYEEIWSYASTHGKKTEKDIKPSYG